MGKMKNQTRWAFWASVLILLSGFSVTSGAHTHEDSLIRWREYSEAAFREAKLNGKPVFMLISAVWCYNCQIYEEQTLSDQFVADYINRHYLFVFVDYDRRRDIAKGYPSVGIPVTSVFAP